MSEIQKLLKKLRKCTDWGMVEAVADALEAAAKRAEATEARLARCVKVLELRRVNPKPRMTVRDVCEEALSEAR